MSKNLGMGVMINMLGDNRETVEAVTNAKGKTIADVAITEDRADGALRFTFTDGSGLLLFDDGRSCCEHRWMHTDDELADFRGAEFRGAELRDGPTEEYDEGWDDRKESQFLIVHTSIGDFTVVNYNEHNGWYGGFWIIAREIEATP